MSATAAPERRGADAGQARRTGAGAGAAGIGWFARHEARLAWRDFRALLSGGRRRSRFGVALGGAVIVTFLHWLANRMFGDVAATAEITDRPTLIVITGILILGWMLMLSQAVEVVTRAFYTRADLELILSSPAAAWQLFSVRIAAMAVSLGLLSLLMAAPFLNVLAWRGGARWLGGYGVLIAFAMLAVAAALALMVAMFRVIGPRRTRLVAQIVAAVIGAVFIVGLQCAAIATYGTLSTALVLQSQAFNDIAPEGDSLIWWPARALLGEIPALLALLGAALALLLAAILAFAPRFGPFAVAAASVGPGARAVSGAAAELPTRSIAQALRHKEWALLRRDPWLASQSLMQILYLIPAAFLLWHHFGDGTDVDALLVPVLIAAAGQLAGGLAWIAVAGEDAPELIASAPVPPRQVLRAKIEAVMSALAAIFLPFIAAIALLSARAGLVALAGVAVVVASSTAIQFWFRAQARHNRMRRRQTPTRLVSVTEALAAINFAASAALLTAGNRLWVVPGLIAAIIVAGAWAVSPARE